MVTHMPYGITHCYLPPGSGDIPALSPAEAGTRLSDPGWVVVFGEGTGADMWGVLRSQFSGRSPRPAANWRRRRRRRRRRAEVGDATVCNLSSEAPAA